MSSFIRPSTARWFAAALAVAFVAGVVTAGRVHAQRRAPVVPAGAMWCGLTDEGGAVHMQLSPDLRFVEWIDISADNNFLISTREGYFNGVARAQIVDSKFIFLKNREERECEPDRGGRERCLVAPCRPGASGGNRPPGPPSNCRVSQVNELNTHGTFRTPDSVHGVYTAKVMEELRGPNQSGRGNAGPVIVRERRLVGNWVAWPSGSAPCP